jgi:hypothetical protein
MKQAIVVAVTTIIAILAMTIMHGEATAEDVEQETIMPKLEDREIKGMESVIVDIFGEYEPIARLETIYITEAYYEPDDEGIQRMKMQTIEVPTVTYGFNWQWATGILLFTVVLYSFFRCVGGILKCKF